MPDSLDREGPRPGDGSEVAGALRPASSLWPTGGAADTSSRAPTDGELPAESDPQPTAAAFRGSLTALYFPAVLSLVEQSNLAGTLIVESPDSTVRFDLDRGVLRAAHRDPPEPEQGLLRALVNRGVLSESGASTLLERGAVSDELAAQLLVAEGIAPERAVLSYFEDAARRMFSEVFELSEGWVRFEPGRPRSDVDLGMRLPVTDLLLGTAVAIDERRRVD